MFRAHAPPQGVCENLVCALTLPANMQAGADNPVGTIFEGAQEQSRLKIERAWRLPQGPRGLDDDSIARSTSGRDDTQRLSENVVTGQVTTVKAVCGEP